MYKVFFKLENCILEISRGFHTKEMSNRLMLIIQKNVYLILTILTCNYKISPSFIDTKNLHLQLFSIFFPDQNWSQRILTEGTSLSWVNPSFMACPFGDSWKVEPTVQIALIIRYIESSLSVSTSRTRHHPIAL